MRTITEAQYKRILNMYNDTVDKEVSAMTTVLSSWGRNSEIDKLHINAEAKKESFKNIFN
ncbi:hypothetical protein PBN151_1282 [Paenibacillus sp. NAIST15-1]|nr:hypothetical protein PBN151_1282 [Paenibacillus sp. NAIST15-1]